MIFLAAAANKTFSFSKNAVCFSFAYGCLFISINLVVMGEKKDKAPAAGGDKAKAGNDEAGLEKNFLLDFLMGGVSAAVRYFSQMSV